MCVLSACMSLYHCMPGAHEDQEYRSLWGWSCIQMILSHHVGIGIQTYVLWKWTWCS